MPGLIFGALWWWGVLRLAFAPDAGTFEGAVAAGGWGLSLLPVHALPKARAAGVAGGRGRQGARQEQGRARGTKVVRAERPRGAGRLTRAWRRRRSGGGSGRS
ncbi:hypothetical protein [Streptomyces sp. NPDC006552]|uniref:hypothetical protein n=1 Tax=Streptomyces sp. NPDC006552 TaxID=3157179 RepID=UPI0033A6A874